MNTSIINPRIIVALDLPTREDALKIVKKLNPKLCRLKIASTMFTHYGPDFVKELISLGFSIFLDLKYYDIPSQVEGACRSAAELGVWMLDLHIIGGTAMMKVAVDALREFPEKQRPLLIGVTILTTMDASDLRPIGIEQNVDGLVIRLAKMAQEASLDGIVCSAQEVAQLRSQLNDNFLFVTPGIRLASDNINDQKRIMTPDDAIKAGSSYLVIGRPITQAQDPLAVLQEITASIS